MISGHRKRGWSGCRQLVALLAVCCTLAAAQAGWTRGLLWQPELIAFADPHVGKACQESDDGYFKDVASLTKCQRLCCSNHDPNDCPKSTRDTVYGCEAFIYDRAKSRCKVYKQCTLQDTDATPFDHWLYKWWSDGELDNWAPEPEPLSTLSFQEDAETTPEFLEGRNFRLYRLYRWSKCAEEASVPFSGADPVTSTQQCLTLCQEELGWKCRGFRFDSQFGRCEFYHIDLPCDLRVASQLDFTYLK